VPRCAAVRVVRVGGVPPGDRPLPVADAGRLLAHGLPTGLRLRFPLRAWTPSAANRSRARGVVSSTPPLIAGVHRQSHAHRRANPPSLFSPCGSLACQLPNAPGEPRQIEPRCTDLMASNTARPSPARRYGRKPHKLPFTCLLVSTIDVLAPAPFPPSP